MGDGGHGTALFKVRHQDCPERGAAPPAGGSKAEGLPPGLERSERPWHIKNARGTDLRNAGERATIKRRKYLKYL